MNLLSFSLVIIAFGLCQYKFLSTGWKYIYQIQRINKTIHSMLFLLAIVLSVLLRITDSDYPFGTSNYF
jgi:hypothetical protein